jgi:hypothetical protein
MAHVPSWLISVVLVSKTLKNALDRQNVKFSAAFNALPDGGTTAMLLGAALGALGITRRYLMSVFPSSKGFPLGRGSGTAREW